MPGWKAQYDKRWWFDLFKRIMLAFDGSETAFRAAEKAFDLARKYQAAVDVVTVAHLPDYAGTVAEVEGCRQDAERFFGENVAKVKQLAARYDLSVVDQLLFGHAGAKLAEYAGEGDFDLVVIGARGHSRLQQVFLGSVSQYVVRSAPCAVLVVKGQTGHGRKV